VGRVPAAVGVVASARLHLGVFFVRNEAVIITAFWLASGLVGGIVMHLRKPILLDAWPVAIALGLVTFALSIYELFSEQSNG